ncbi:MAG: substrate-binding domain-containing protein [Spirochaetales bacterium]|uniref:Substrate-binding domain-containing protein n=1 Tax=Candidatus Thalassospirochaeta sargassi TaxID=3119039 RepID=A0AAJ1IFF6_9SPIO|nr:substrate-binding domain-containing protein [Spirochaetales bacterium]
MKKNFMTAILLVVMVTMVFAGGQQESGDGYVIGFSNSFNGNTYRQAEEAEFIKLADQLVAEGVLADYTILESNQNTATQVSQIESLILDGVDAIIVDPGSASGLNGAIESAVDAGIPVVVVNGGPVTTNAPYQINFPYRKIINVPAQFVADSLDGEGNVIIIRGIAGVPADAEFYAGMMDIFNKYPGINIVGEVYGEWTGSVAQQQVASILPSCPEVDAVIGEGGDAYGAMQAFEAAGREIPLIIGGNRGNFLTWWAAEAKANGYETMSWCTNAWTAALGLYVAIDILDGVDVPKDMEFAGTLGGAYIYQDMIEDYADLAADDIAFVAGTHEWIKENLYTQE